MASVDLALRALLDELVAADNLGPGDRLPTERELMVRLQVSRSAVRRGLDALEREGRITRWVGRGTFLAVPHAHAASDTPNVSPARIMQARMLLEPPLAALAVSHAGLRDLEELQRQLERETKVSNFEEAEAADIAIHRAIARATHNELLLSAFDVMNGARQLPIWGSSKRRATSIERRAVYHAAHVQIVAALADRDPAAAEAAMRAHLQIVTNDLLGGAGEGATDVASLT